MTTIIMDGGFYLKMAELAQTGGDRMTNRDKVNEMARYCAVHDCRKCGIREECHHAGIRWKPELTWSGLLKEYPNSFGLVYSAVCKIMEEKPADGKPEEKADITRDKILDMAKQCV